MAIAERTVTVDGNRIHYRQAGENGPVVVLLHGGIIDAATVSWGAVIEPLSEECQVFAPDLLGYGASDLPPGPITIERHVETIAGFLDAIDVDAPTVVGLSMGGAIGLGLALDDPDRLDRLMLIDSYGLGRELPNGLLSYALARVQEFNRIAIDLFRLSKRLTRASLAGIVHDLDALDPAAVDAVYEEVKRPKAGIAFRRFRESEITRSGYRTCYLDELEDLVVPTRLLHGAHDEVVPVAWAQRAAERIPDASLRVLDHCAHWPPREDPETVVAEIREWATVREEPE
jgi:pimeloyl-ACP methyl ester carboxylesterase